MKTYLYLSTAIISVSLAASGEAWAQCVSTQDCATLGYTESSCPNGGVKCPFGNKWFCGGDSTTICKQEGFTNACTGAGQCGLGEACANLYKQCDNSTTYKYTCSGEGYAGGSGSACGGKYTQCKCASGYEWKDGACQKQVQNGAVGDLYYCNGAVVGVKASGMNFYVAMKDLGAMTWSNANSSCQSYVFCGSIKGTLPTKDQLLTIYNNKSTINSLLSTNGGTKMTESYYWSSTYNTNAYGFYYYIVDMSDGGGLYGYNHYLDNNYNVRPVLASW